MLLCLTSENHVQHKISSKESGVRRQSFRDIETNASLFIRAHLYYVAGSNEYVAKGLDLTVLLESV